MGKGWVGVILLQLKPQQKHTLYRFIAEPRRRDRSLDSDLQQTLGYIMAKVDVRKKEQIADQAVRELVGSVFEILKSEYLLENHLITALRHQETVSGARARARQYYPHVHADAGAQAYASPR